MSKQIEALRKLGLTDAEIEQVLADDKRIDKGEKLFELSAEQEKASKQARKADRKPTVYKLDNTAGKRSKKEDSDKATLMNALFTAILGELVKEGGFAAVLVSHQRIGQYRALR